MLFGTTGMGETTTEIRYVNFPIPIPLPTWTQSWLIPSGMEHCMKKPLSDGLPGYHSWHIETTGSTQTGFSHRRPHLSLKNLYYLSLHYFAVWCVKFPLKGDLSNETINKVISEVSWGCRKLVVHGFPIFFVSFIHHHHHNIFVMFLGIVLLLLEIKL